MWSTWAQPAASGNRPLVRESEEGRDGGGAARPKGRWCRGPPACWCCTELSAASPCTSFAPSPTVKTEVRWEHLKRLTEIFPKVYSNCGERYHTGWWGGNHKGTTTQEQKLLNRPDLPRAPDLMPTPHSSPPEQGVAHTRHLPAPDHGLSSLGHFALQRKTSFCVVWAIPRMTDNESIHPIKGKPSLLTKAPYNYSIITRMFLKFWAVLPNIRICLEHQKLNWIWVVW